MEQSVEKLKKAIEAYVPFNAQEAADQKAFLFYLSNQPSVWSRENTTGHVTASAWLVNSRRDQVIMVYHNIYKSWAWTGGHADGEADLLKVAIKEAKEETGLEDVKSLSDDIYSLEVLTVDGHEKKGKYVASHLHFNITYLLTASEDQNLSHNPDENQDVRWFSLEEGISASTEPYMQGIYRKLNEKLKVMEVK